MKKTLTLILAASAAFSGFSHGATLLIDFSSDAETQAGWEGLGGTADGTPKTGTFSGYTDLSAGNITVTVAGTGLFNRGHNNGTGLGSDFIGTDLDEMYADILARNTAGGTINVTIAGLKAGTYQITTHHLINTPNPGTFKLDVQDADSASFSQSIGTFTQGTGVSGPTGSFNPNVITYDVVSNGTDPVIVRMTQVTASSGGNTGGWYGFNGMEIAIPEPSSLLLSGLGALVLLRRRR